ERSAGSQPVDELPHEVLALRLGAEHAGDAKHEMLRSHPGHLLDGHLLLPVFVERRDGIVLAVRQGRPAEDVLAREDAEGRAGRRRGSGERGRSCPILGEVTTAPSTTGVDVDALMNEVRARIRQRKDTGRFDAGVQAALDRPLPGGTPLFTDGLADPLKALPDVLDADSTYDPRSRKRYVGPLITLARRTAIWLLRFWVGDIVERQ